MCATNLCSVLKLTKTNGSQEGGKLVHEAVVLEMIRVTYVNVALYLQETLFQSPETVSLHVWLPPARKK